MNILVMSAMVEEIDYLVQNFNLTAIEKINGNDLYKVVNNNTTVYILNCGIGKVNSSITTTVMLSKYKIDKLISIGTSGALTNKTAIGDFVVGDKLAYHDVDVTAFGYEIGQLPQMDKYFPTTKDKFWTSLIEQFSTLSGVNVHFGDIITGDQFVNNNDKKKFINDNFEAGLCVEMESTAIIHTASSLGVDCYVMRSISDNADSAADVSFDEYLSQVCVQYKKFVDLILSNE